MKTVKVKVPFTKFTFLHFEKIEDMKKAKEITKEFLGRLTESKIYTQLKKEYPSGFIVISELSVNKKTYQTNFEEFKKISSIIE